MSRFYCLSFLDPDAPEIDAGFSMSPDIPTPESDAEHSMSADSSTLGCEVESSMSADTSTVESDAGSAMSADISTVESDAGSAMSTDISTLEPDGGRNTSPDTSASEPNARGIISKLPWLPIEVQLKIVDYLFDATKPKINSRGQPVREPRPRTCAALGAAQTCFWWRERLGPLIYPNMFLTQHCVSMLRHLAPAQREQVRYVKLAIELEDQPCCAACPAPSEDGGKVAAAATAKARGLKSPMAKARVQKRSNLRATQAALECLFRCLSDWPLEVHADGTTGLRLEIGLVCRECAEEHTVPDAGHLGTRARCIDTDGRLKLVQVPAVRELIMRQQSRYRLGPRIMAGIFRALPTVRSMLYEPWRFQPHEERYRRDSHLALMITSLPRTMQRLTLPEDLDADHHPRDLPKHYERDPRGLNGPEFCTFAFREARRRLETLSVSHIIEADHFFSALDLEGRWPALRSVHMTSRLMLPPSSGSTEEGRQEHMLQVNCMLRMVARQTVSCMPRIKKLVLWNGDVGAAGAFIFHVQRRGPESENGGGGGAGELHASIAWRGTWSPAIDGTTLGSWSRLARSCTQGNPLGMEWPQMLDESAIDSRSTAVRMLGLTEAVMDTMSLE